jgi:dolichol kinase
MIFPRLEMDAVADENVSLKYEFLRKGIHMMSLSIPILYYFISKTLALQLVGAVAAIFLILDLLRTFHKPTHRLYQKVFGKMLRNHEKTKEFKALNGATWVLFSAFLCILVFPKIIAITAFAVLIISDSTAAIIGKKFGTIRFNGKTLEGSSAFVVSAAIVVMFTPKVGYLPGEYFIGIAASIVGAIAEIFSFKIVDDNFSIPISIGIVLWILYAVFFPQLNLYILEG